jgi:sugar phosphate isomerase/epimerase
MNDFLKSREDETLRFPLSLHHLCALDATPAELVALASAMGCAHVCLFTHVPEAARRFYTQVTADDIPALRTRMDEAGVSLCNMEVFPLDGREDWAAFETGLKTGAALGATRATAHIHDADTKTAVRRFALFCDMAATHGIIAGLEFNAFSGVKDIITAAAIVRAAGHANGQLVCDMLHLVRSNGTAEDVAAAANLIGYAQISDGPATLADADRWHEAIRERMLPGNGAFPIVDAFRHLRPGTVVEIEVPQTAARKAGVGADERVRGAVEASRAVLSGIKAAEIMA